MNKKLLILPFLISLCFSFVIGASVTWAEEIEETNLDEEISQDQEKIDDLQGQIKKYQKKIDDLEGKARSYEEEIAYLDSQIGLTELQIQNSNAMIEKEKREIQRLQEDIDDIGLRINKIEGSIDYQRSVLSSRMRERYKSKVDTVLVLLFGNDNFQRFIQKTEYLQVMEKHDNKLLTEMGDTKVIFKNQQNLFEEKKIEEEQLKALLEQEKANLDSYKSDLVSKQNERSRLLAATNNDAAKYQTLLTEAQAQLDSFLGFIQYAGGGVIGSNEFGFGKEGWYLSQRDSRWAGKTIGKSQYSIFEVGCLLTSVAMVYNRYNYSVSPADIAKDSSRFFSSTAMMLIPWVGPPGTSYTSIYASTISSELDKGRPVIVGVYAGPYGTHFVVLASEKNGDYIMYDPWYGPDLKFSDYYTKGSIFQAIVFK